MLPSATPYLLAGLRLAAGRALIGAVVAEFFTAIGGLGYYILYNSRTFHHNEAFVGVLLLAAFGVGFELAGATGARAASCPGIGATTRALKFAQQEDRMTDPVLKAAIAHWAPRFVANGVALTDFEEVTASISTWDDWCRAWSARAAIHEEIGREALAQEAPSDRRRILQRAGVYYHFAKFLFVHDLAQMKAAHMKAVECRQAALPHLDPPGERVEIPYEGKTLYGILRKPPGDRAAAGRGDGDRSRFDQGRNRRL